MSIWEHASKRKNAGIKECEAICGYCNKVMKCSGGSTTSLKAHLKSKHGIDSSINPNNEKQVTDEKKPRTMSDYFNRWTLKEIVADLATDGISIRVITRNKYIRDSVTKSGFKLPVNESGVMNLIHADYEDKKIKMFNKIKSQIDSGKKFSMTVDEYTTIRRRRYFGVNLHVSESNKTLQTGLIRIMGSCNAESMVEKITEHLREFGINVEKDIVGSTQDGAAINKKFIGIIKVIEQYCLNHAIHLGVCDTLYKTTAEFNPIEIDSDSSDESDIFEDPLDIQVVQDNLHDSMYYNELLKNARCAVKFIRSSSVRNQVFQDKVKTKFGMEIELHLDVRHRWNSITAMTAPLIKTKNCLIETFNELQMVEIINKLDFISLCTLHESMEPIKLAVEALSSENATLLTAKTIVDFMLHKLSESNSIISLELYDNLKKRIDERWNIDLMSLLKCLNDPSNVPSKNTISFAGKLASRLFGYMETVPQTDSNQTVDVKCTESITYISLKDELNALLQKEKMAPSKTVPDDFKWLKQEFVLFKNTGKRTENLQKLFDALMTIKPTSTDVERVFSICTNFCSKIRSRLSDKSLNALVFLKFQYKK